MSTSVDYSELLRFKPNLVLANTSGLWRVEGNHADWFQDVLGKQALTPRDVSFSGRCADDGFEFSQVVPYAGNPQVAFALQPEGDESEDLAYRYADYKSYSAGAYNDGTDFINPDTFQLIGFGIDGKSAPAGNVFAAAPEDDDNICNFAEGRLDKYVNENE